MIPDADRCVSCRQRWRQEAGKLCTTCYKAQHDASAAYARARRPIGGVRKVYTPPARSPVRLKDPRTGEVREYEIVFDGR